ncbi:MAG: hypothetical protein FWF29_01700 [Treponema sp.]|nr:hypothetical protein [Treponema sp.]
MRRIVMTQALCVFALFFVLAAGCGTAPAAGSGASGNSVIWDWNYERDGWNFGGTLSNLPGVGDGSTTGLSAGGSGKVINDMLVYARARPVVENKEYGGLQLGGKGANSVTRLLIGGMYSGDTAAPEEGVENVYWDGDTAPQIDLTRPVRITVTIPHYVLHKNRSLLIIRVNNNTGTNANSPLGSMSTIGQLNGSANFSGKTIDNLDKNEKGEYVFVVEYHPDKFRDNPGKSTLKKSYLGLQAQSPGNADGAGPDTENYIVISSIKIEYDNTIRARR